MTTGATNGDDARRAEREAREQLRRQQGLWGAVRRSIASLSALAEENHFTEKIIDAMRGKT
jgi:hypothetical protein